MYVGILAKGDIVERERRKREKKGRKEGREEKSETKRQSGELVLIPTRIQ